MYYKKYFLFTFIALFTLIITACNVVIGDSYLGSWFSGEGEILELEDGSYKLTTQSKIVNGEYTVKKHDDYSLIQLDYKGEVVDLMYYNASKNKLCLDDNENGKCDDNDDDTFYKAGKKIDLNAGMVSYFFDSKVNSNDTEVEFIANPSSNKYKMKCYDAILSFDVECNGSYHTTIDVELDKNCNGTRKVKKRNSTLNCKTIKSTIINQTGKVVFDK